MSNEDINNKIVIYTTSDGKINLEVQIDANTVWLTQQQIGLLYGKAKSTISEHLTHIFEEGELDPKVVVRENRTTSQHGAIEGKTQENLTRFYNLDAILAVGFRVRSKQGTLFRQWAIERLKDYIVKGFAIDTERLKGNGGGQYWYELLNTIKDNSNPRPRKPKENNNHQSIIINHSSFIIKSCVSHYSFRPSQL